MAVITLFVGCTSTESIQKNMNIRSYSMAYIKDSKIAKVKSETYVSIDSIYLDSALMGETTLVRKEKGWFIPLLFFNIWKTKNTCIQGKSMIEGNVPDFLRNSISEEINRSGEFKLDSLTNTDYKIELSIDEFKSEGPYISSGFFYFFLYAYGFSYSDNAGPAISNLTISYKLKKGEQVVCAKSFFGETFTEQINRGYNDISQLQQDYAISMVEANSRNFKRVIELIVDDINRYFGENN